MSLLHFITAFVYDIILYTSTERQCCCFPLVIHYFLVRKTLFITFFHLSVPFYVPLNLTYISLKDEAIAYGEIKP